MPLFVEWMRRKPGTSNTEFTAYWRDHHAPIVRDRPEVKAALRADKYTHYRTLPDDRLNAEMIAARGWRVASYDGICIPESSSLSIDDYAQALAEEGGDTLRAWMTLLHDEVNFMDMATSIPCFATQETPFSAPGTPPSAHVMICYRAADGVAIADFLDFRRTVFATKVADLRVALGPVRYRQVVPIDTPLNEQFGLARGCLERPYDAMDVFSFSSRADVERSWRTGRAAWDELARAESHLIRPEDSTLVVTESAVIFDDQAPAAAMGREQPLSLGDATAVR